MPVIAQNQQLLQYLAPEEKIALERICPPRKFKKGQAIYRYQDRADDLFIVHEGKVKITAPTADAPAIRAAIAVAICASVLPASTR